MEAAFTLLILEFRLCIYKSAAAPGLAANDSRDHNHPSSQFERRLSDWLVSCMPTRPCPTLFVETKPIRRDQVGELVHNNVFQFVSEHISL